MVTAVPDGGTQARLGMVEDLHRPEANRLPAGATTTAGFTRAVAAASYTASSAPSASSTAQGPDPSARSASAVEHLAVGTAAATVSATATGG